jgi:hypothetical protein
MKTFRGILGLLCLVIVGAQTARHVYVQWVEPRTSVLDKYDTTRQQIHEAKSLDELNSLYAAALEKVKAAGDAEAGEEDSYEREYRLRNQEPYKTEIELKRAIQTWEEHHREVAEVHFFWWVGLAAFILAWLAYVRGHVWFGLSLFVAAFLEMIWATAPALRMFGWQLEFDRLLTWKTTYSSLTLVLTLIAWITVERRENREATSSRTTTA